MKKTNILAAAVLMSAVSAYAFTAQAKPLTAEEFAAKAAISGKFEIESSKVALERSQNEEVKSFAKTMIDDHTKADKELKAAAAEAKLSPTALPDDLDEKHLKKVNKLKEAKAEDFDNHYLEAQEEAHDDAVDLFEDYIKDGEAGPLKDFASKTLPTLKEHEKHAESLEEKHDDKGHTDAKPAAATDVKETKEEPKK